MIRCNRDFLSRSDRLWDSLVALRKVNGNRGTYDTALQEMHLLDESRRLPDGLAPIELAERTKKAADNLDATELQNRLWMIISSDTPPSGRAQP